MNEAIRKTMGRRKTVVAYSDHYETHRLDEFKDDDVLPADLVLVYSGNGGFGVNVLKNRTGPIGLHEKHWTEVMDDLGYGKEAGLG